jgi:hypothetical protein
MLLTFTPTVGVAPGTTTMTLGEAKPAGLVCLGGPCPPDPARYYSTPPTVKSGWGSGANGPSARTIYDPYATESQLRSGLRGLGEARVGVGVVAAALAFAAVLGFGFWKRRK